jgi:hypothetical protein
MPAQQLLLEDDPAMLDADAQPGPALRQLGVQLGLQRLDALDQECDLRAHVRAPWPGN